MSTSPRTSDVGSQSVVQLKLDDIVPYWRNPRRITDSSVSAVAKSIQDYGYQQPIVVDAENVIIIGHTRYAAMRRLRIDTLIPCIKLIGLSPTKVKELRVLDNKVAEYTSWDFEQLMAELHELDQDLMRVYFPEADTIVDDGPEVDVGVDTDPNRVMPWDTVGQPNTPAEFVCPSCFHSWTLEINEDMVRSGEIAVTEAAEA